MNIPFSLSMSLGGIESFFALPHVLGQVQHSRERLRAADIEKQVERFDECAVILIVGGGRCSYFLFLQRVHFIVAGENFLQAFLQVLVADFRVVSVDRLFA